MSITISHKMVWFDRALLFSKAKPGVAAAYWRAFNETPIKRAGLMVMTIARRSIRRRPAGSVSRPGQPPFAHPKSKNAKVPEFKQIFSVPDRWSTTAMVGMVGYGSHDPPVPALHEFGGAARRLVYPSRRRLDIQRSRGTRRKRVQQLRGGFEVNEDAVIRLMARDPMGRFLPYRQRQENSKVVQSVTYPARPFMRPALEKAASQLPGLWRNSLIGAS